MTSDSENVGSRHFTPINQVQFTTSRETKLDHAILHGVERTPTVTNLRVGGHSAIGFICRFCVASASVTCSPSKLAKTVYQAQR